MNILQFYRHTTRKLFVFLFLATLPFHLSCSGGFRGDNKNADDFTKTIFHPEKIENDTTDN